MGYPANLLQPHRFIHDTCDRPSLDWTRYRQLLPVQKSGTLGGVQEAMTARGGNWFCFPFDADATPLVKLSPVADVR